MALNQAKTVQLPPAYGHGVEGLSPLQLSVAWYYTFPAAEVHECIHESLVPIGITGGLEALENSEVTPTGQRAWQTAKNEGFAPITANNAVD